MKTPTLLVAVALVSLALSGCVNEEESTTDDRARGFSVSVPENVHRLRVNVSASSRDDATVRVEVEREDRSNVGEATFDLKNANAPRSIEADVGDMSTVWVLATVTGGDAIVRITVYGIADDGTEMLLRTEVLEITAEPRPYTPPAEDTAQTDTNATTNETNSSQ